ncbi:hypothetical protein OKW39_008567 [Paraburkholderia sp. MM6662-R1]
MLSAIKRHPAVRAFGRSNVESAQQTVVRWAQMNVASSVFADDRGGPGDSHDDALGETINGLHKAELIHCRTPWKTRESVELASLEWVA